MGYSVNTITVSGNVARPPELRQAGSTQVLGFTICYDERYKQGDEWKSRPNYFDVSVFGRLGESLAQELSKGSKVVVSGRLRQTSWEKDGQRHYSTGIVATDVVTMQQRAQQQQRQYQQQPVVAAAPPQPDVYDEDIPF